jgi:hypothetical protein
MVFQNDSEHTTWRMTPGNLPLQRQMDYYILAFQLELAMPGSSTVWSKEGLELSLGTGSLLLHVVEVTEPVWDDKGSVDADTS